MVVLYLSQQLPKRICNDIPLFFFLLLLGERALSTLNSTSILGKPCRIMWSQRDIAKRKVAGGNIFVKNLDPSITSKSLRDTFAQYGNIISCKVVLDPQGQSKGYGFVHYDTTEAAENAIRQVNGTILYDREL